MTKVEKQIIQNLVSEKRRVLSVKFPKGKVSFVLAGETPELNEKITKTKPTADFVYELSKMAVDPNKCAAPCRYCGTMRGLCGDCYLDNSLFTPISDGKKS